MTKHWESALLSLCVFLAWAFADVGSRHNALLSRVAALESRVSALQLALADLSQRAGAQGDASPAGSVGVYTNTYSADPNLVYVDRLRHIPPAALALSALGAVYVQGEIITDSCVRFVYRGRPVDLCDLYGALLQLNREACAVECQYGILDGSCNCICETGWSGAACDTNTCSGRGTWSNGECTCTDPTYDPAFFCATRICAHGALDLTGNCVCSDGYSGPACDVPGGACGAGCAGTCINGRCMCSQFQVGPGCSYDCSAAGVQAGACFFEHTNRGYDMCRTISGATVCVCGGGFSLKTTAVETKVGVCRGCSSGAMDLARCCAPDVFCTPAALCLDQACCTRQGVGSCLESGCHLCGPEGAEVCALASVASLNCTAPSTSSQVLWDRRALNCSDPANVVLCSPYMRRRYGQIYNSFPTLAEARVAVNSEQWTLLSSDRLADFEATFFIRVADSPFPCTSSYYIGIGQRFENTGANLFSVVCGKGAALSFWLGVVPPATPDDEPGTALYYYDGGHLHCLAGKITVANIFDSFTNAKSGDGLQVVGVPIHTDADAFFFCGSVEYTGGRLATPSDGNALAVDVSTSRDLLWLASEPWLTVAIEAT